MVLRMGCVILLWHSVGLFNIIVLGTRTGKCVHETVLRLDSDSCSAGRKSALDSTSFKPYKPSVLFMGHRQTELPKM